MTSEVMAFSDNNWIIRHISRHRPAALTDGLDAIVKALWPATR